VGKFPPRNALPTDLLLKLKERHYEAIKEINFELKKRGYFK